MKPAILLIDLQNDFLAAPSLEPAAGQIIEQAAQLLEGGRKLGTPIIHVWTSVNLKHDRRMPHWKRADKRMCVVGTAGHAAPPSLCPLSSETIIHKTFFSAFSNGELDSALKSLRVDMLILAGVHLHGCIRATVLDAYQRGFAVWVAQDAVGSDDPLHAAITQRYLAARAAQFVSVEKCLDAIRQGGFQIATAMPKQVSQSASRARRAWLTWRDTSFAARRKILNRFAAQIEDEADSLARAIATEVGKPLVMARAEVQRSVALVHAAVKHAANPLEKRCAQNSVKRFRPLGVVAVITPWNNPLAIPVGKLAPALAYGNTVVWKPSPFAEKTAARVKRLLEKAGCPDGAVNLVRGDRDAALALMSHPEIDAVTITGSAAAGYAALDICGRRHIPLQAELGGNNAAIVWRDCDMERAAQRIVAAAFAFAGQRCTANRRAIVDIQIYSRFLAAAQRATAALDKDTHVGSLISEKKRRDADALVLRALMAGATVLTPHQSVARGAYFPPTIVCCDDPTQEIVQEESFAPILVVQGARDWQHAMRLCNGVRQGLVAALFSESKEIQARFLADAQAGILKINEATADADAEAPFGGWKASGIGAPEHGASNREFYTRTQAVYRARS
jgi:acyl-CoA reductase-like NAD-dependent aldehyde dehydrogenase